MADCSKGGIQPPETHGRRQWITVYVGSPAAWMTTIAEGRSSEKVADLKPSRRIEWTTVHLSKKLIRDGWPSLGPVSMCQQNVTDEWRRVEQGVL